MDKAILSYRKNPTPFVIRCEVMNYEWGDKRFIPDLLGIGNPEGKPYAELWIGAHPQAPAKAVLFETEVNLNEVIRAASEEILGKDVARKFNATLPYLFKVLTAAGALSIQSHPNKKQAEQGFDRENKLGIDFKSENRNYKDDNHKPEVICALTNFWALNGFRHIDEIISLFDELDIPELKEEFNIFKQAIEKGSNNLQLRREALRNFYTGLMNRMKLLKIPQTTREETEVVSIISYVVGKSKAKICQVLNMRVSNDFQEVIEAVEKAGKMEELKHQLWTLRLNEQYPNDLGVLSVYLLNLIRLKPGQAMFLPPGELHTYLGKLNPKVKDEAAGIELMANSDNVLRGGLTSKYVDVPELLNTLTFNSGRPKILTPKARSSTEGVYRTPAFEFELSVIEIDNKKDFISSKSHSAEALIVFGGRVEVIDSKGNRLKLQPGQTFLVPAVSDIYIIKAREGRAQLYKAGIPWLVPTF